MSTMRCKQKGFGPSPIQHYKVCSPCRNNKPSTESVANIESIVHLSSILLRYYRWHFCPYPR